MTTLTLRYVLYLAMFASAGALITALIAQYGFGLRPCILCSYQRIPYVAVLVFGLLTLIIGKSEHRVVGILLGSMFLVGAALAFYHYGVEQYWWETFTSCDSAGALPMSVQDLKLALNDGPMPRACDDIGWSLFDVSITVYNTIYSLALAAACFWSARSTHG